MKKLFLILLIAPLFWGCEKYEMITDPYHKINGRWFLKSIKFNIISCQNCNTKDSASIKLVNEETIALTAFKFDRYENDKVRLVQDIKKVSHSRLFRKSDFNPTKWEFETYQMSTFYNGSTKGELDCWVNYYPTSDRTGRIEIRDAKMIDDRAPVSTTWRYITDGGEGVSQADLLTLSSPEVTTDLLLNGRNFDKLITYKLIIEFGR